MKLDNRLLQLIGSARFAFWATVGLGFAGGVLVVVQARLVSHVISQVFLKHNSLADVTGLLGVLIIIYCLRAGTIWGGEVAGNQLTVRVKANLRARLFKHLQDLGPIFLQNDKTDGGGTSTGSLVNTAVEGIESLDAYFSQYLPQIVLAALVPLTYLAFVLPLDPLSGAVLLLTAPLIPLFMILIGDLADNLTKDRWETLSRMSAYFLDVLQGLTTLKILGRSRDQIKVIAQVSERFRVTTMGVLRVAFLSALVLELVATLSTAIVAVEIGLRLLNGRLAFEQAFFVLLLAPEFYLPLRALGTRFHAGMAGFEAAQSIFQILDRKPPVDQSRGIKAIPIRLADWRSANDIPPTITFDKVSFAYPQKREALREVSFQIQPYRKTAVVGPSGAGKSTLAYLLLRFIEPQQGAIKVDGACLQEFCQDEWRKHASWVPQSAYLFNATIEANIRLARPEADGEAVIRAARLAYAHDFIMQLPQGYNTLTGERGVRLSAGQAQRIALARAFLKDAPLLILDEASANLDLCSETVIQAALKELTKNRTVVIIAHRLSTVRDADQIVLLDHGEIKAIGKHTELLKRSPLYRNMVTSYAGAATSAESDRRDQPHHSLAGTGDSGLPNWTTDPPADARPPQLSRFQAFLRLLRLLAPFKGWMLLATLLSAATIASGIGLMTTSAFIIAAAALQPSIAVLQVPIVGVRFFGLARGIFRYLERYISHDITFRLLAKLRVNVYEALEPLAPAGLTLHRSGDLLGRVTAEVESLDDFYVRAVAPPLTAVFMTGITAVFMARFNAILALTLAAFLVAAGLGVPWLVRRLSASPGRQLVTVRSRLNAALVDGIQGNADLKVFGGDDRKVREVAALDLELGKAQARMSRIGGLQEGLMNLAANVGAWSVLTLTIPMVSAGQIEGVYLAVLFLGALTSFEALLPLPVAAQHLERSLEAARRLFELADSKPEVEEIGDGLPVAQRGSLCILDLRFRYPATKRPAYRIGSRERNANILDGITFTLPEGHHLAIVGPSGAGKSTLVNLLLRFWEYERGEISLAGEDIRKYAACDLRQAIAVVPQDPYLFNVTVRDNLRIAGPAASEAEIHQAAKQAQMHEFIRTLPQGYDTWIGEHGLRLSAGQRQRLAIARALLKNAPVMVLDEPTANLDPVTEQAVLQAIFQTRKNRTTLLITHRLVEMEWMDEILVLDQGRIVERGRHDALLLAGGLYWQMWERQNQILRVGEVISEK
ncbi:MAG TPA: thiol reductant ABC exporter subunit CydD [Anaerolineales bacterium]